MKGILGKKIGMTRVIQDDGRVIPITVVVCEPNVITQVKTTEKDGYRAIVLGFEQKKNPTKTKKFKFVKEIKIAEGEEYKKGDTVSVEIFNEGDEVSVTGTSKGKGFQGVVRRHHMKGGPGSHGSHFKREPGSVGARAKPGRIVRGKRMAGHMGDETVTSRTIISYLDKKNHLIGIRGPLPGGNHSYITIKKQA